MIRIENLTQIYKSGKGIFDISFEIEKGEVFGYLGPNGAGKTTTIRGVLGQMNATEGLVNIGGLNPRKEIEKVNKILGYLPGEIAFFDNYSGSEFLKYISNMRKLDDLSLMKDLIERFDLDINMKIKKMSKGMKQKLGIVSAFMHNPEILILDEPTSGLDPLMQNKFLDLIKEEKHKGKTILMSSHIFEEVNKVCDRVGIIKDGHIVAIENLLDNKIKLNDYWLITLEDENDEILESDLNCEKIKQNQYKVTLSDNYQNTLQTLSKYKVIKIDIYKQTLEDLFIKYYGGDMK